MAALIARRDDRYGPTLRQLAKVCSEANQTRRLLAFTVEFDGGRTQWRDPADCSGQ
jgi:hypothetical protein